ncbi:MAG: FAD-dependent oxidoreductase [Mycobacterium sp.]|uniref:hydroxysqualene dehydroxylase n=1 Tax=Mycobacterium sp. TaxID=1785 RepID=UPI001EB1AE4A|nr:FAD-dependent oxidoreductase [Mycobacterium sp.]MBW0017845.1 FAD-dependent oxidoreductase [Mycobacterium sp.]
MTNVAILGGGVGGLSAAHELAERGFTVTVYERRDDFGGKARSMPYPGTGKGTGKAKRKDLPAEHGFRFFPGFYRHLPDTMKRIPYARSTVFDNLVPTTRMMLAQDNGRNEIIAPSSAPSSFDDLEVGLDFIWTLCTGLGIPTDEAGELVELLLVYLTSCEERRLKQWELLSWWEFVDAEHKSRAFQKFLATGLTRTLVAARADEISARTGASILCQLMFDLTRPGGHADRVLNAPTNDAWIRPWISHLKSRGVAFRAGCGVTEIHCEGTRISGVTINGAERITADYYVAALPVERFCDLLTDELVGAEPALDGARRLETRWMNGVMFYLRQDRKLVHGHIIFIDSPWALTAISQAQFWHDVHLEDFGNGRVHGILSVDVSDWDAPDPVTKRRAMDCSKEQIGPEVWAQIIAHIDDGSLEWANVVDWFLDPAIQFGGPGEVTNAEPLLINRKGSWAERPDAVTRIPNLFLAADFVRTNTDLATMEGANEAARRAVNGILKATGSRAPRCEVWKLREPSVLIPFRVLDEVRWRLGLDVRPPIKVSRSGRLEPTDLAARALLTTTRRTRSALASLAALGDSGAG